MKGVKKVPVLMEMVREGDWERREGGKAGGREGETINLGSDGLNEGFENSD